MPNKSLNDTSLQSTKQMLDELDAMMERMLSLPVNELDDTLFPNTVVKPPPPAPALSLLQQPPPLPVKASVEPARQVEPVPHPVINPPHLALPPVEPEIVEAAPPPLTNDVAPPSLLPRIEPLLAEVSADTATPTLPWGYLPLLWVNQAFDHATLALGAAGRGLRSQVGRALLGLSGIAMLLASVGWFLKDWLGWTW